MPGAYSLVGGEYLSVCRSANVLMIIFPQLKEQARAYPVVRLMAQDYLPIPASTCLAEWSFSTSARTDDARRRQMGGEKFGALQRLRAAYRDGWLSAMNEAWMEIDPDFEFSSSDTTV